MTLPIKIVHGEAWRFRGIDLRYERELGSNLLHFLDERTGGPFQVISSQGVARLPDCTWLLEGLASGELRRRVNIEGLPFVRREAATFEYDFETATALDPAVPLRRAILKALDDAGDSGLSDRALTQKLLELWAELPANLRSVRTIPSCRTVRRWLKERGSAGERRTNQLMALSGRVARARRLPPVTVKLLMRTAEWYWKTPKFSIEDAYSRLSLRIFRINRRRARYGLGDKLKLPSPEILRREIRKLESYETYRLKFGEKKANIRFKANGRGLSATRFLQLGCMDHTQLDVFAIDGELMLPLGKPWLTVLIDIRSRCIVAFVLTWEPPSLYAALECVKRANRPKLLMLAREPRFPILSQIFGKFDEIVVDNGRELSGTSFQDALGDIGTSVRWTPVGEPTFKAIGERFFLTLNHLLVSKLPGSTQPTHILRQADYDPAKHAALTVGELEDLIWRAISYYHIEEHSSLKRPPASLWAHDVQAYCINMIGDDSQLTKMAGAVVRERQVTRAGVRLFGLQYHSTAETAGLLNDLIGLQPKRGEPKGSARVLAKIKYNPADISEIHVWNVRRKRYVTLPCTDERYSAGLTLWHHKQLTRWTVERGLEFSSIEDRLRARAALTAAVQEATPDARFRQRRAYARLLNSPRIDGHQTGRIEVVTAEPRHDGMAPIIQHSPLANTREDDGKISIRPSTRGRKAARPKVRKHSAKEASIRPQAETPDDLDPSEDWKGFDL